jgi:hypothetical protein
MQVKRPNGKLWHTAEGSSSRRLLGAPAVDSRSLLHRRIGVQKQEERPLHTNHFIFMQQTLEFKAELL